MSLATIRLHPSMTYEMLISALNDNFALLENINRTLVMRDETGKNRVVIGRAPNGSYVVAISVAGTDVLKALDE